MGKELNKLNKCQKGISLILEGCKAILDNTENKAVRLLISYTGIIVQRICTLIIPDVTKAAEYDEFMSIVKDLK